jgi:molybdopterin/thiamine biosynthesis adenylyltransferase
MLVISAPFSSYSMRYQTRTLKATCGLLTIKYRIWGDQGQAALEKASICLLNCGPTGTEALKNLVLGGIGSVTIVDGSKVEASDLGNNFLRKFCVLILHVLLTYIPTKAM